MKHFTGIAHGALYKTFCNVYRKLPSLLEPSAIAQIRAVTWCPRGASAGIKLGSFKPYAKSSLLLQQTLDKTNKKISECKPPQKRV